MMAPIESVLSVGLEPMQILFESRAVLFAPAGVPLSFHEIVERELFAVHPFDLGAGLRIGE